MPKLTYSEVQAKLHMLSIAGSYLDLLRVPMDDERFKDVFYNLDVAYEALYSRLVGALMDEDEQN